MVNPTGVCLVKARASRHYYTAHTDDGDGADVNREKPVKHKKIRVKNGEENVRRNRRRRKKRSNTTRESVRNVCIGEGKR